MSYIDASILYSIMHQFSFLLCKFSVLVLLFINSLFYYTSFRTSSCYASILYSIMQVFGPRLVVLLFINSLFYYAIFRTSSCYASILYSILQVFGPRLVMHQFSIKIIFCKFSDLVFSKDMCV